MDLSTFAKQHASQITATAGLVTYAATRKKLTPLGIIAGIFVAGVHMLHPWPAFFWLLMVFFLVGTGVTKIGHNQKTRLTQSSTGGTGGEGPRSASQVFANSGWACILILLHAYLLQHSSPFISSHLSLAPGPQYEILKGLLPIGIIAQYAAVAADTFSSELGILSRGEPVMITAPWKRVPRGTNGGVTVDGLKYGMLGGALLTLVAILTLAFAEPRVSLDGRTAVLLILAGLAGSVIDSILGAHLQATVMDRGTGKVVEGHGGQRVKVLEGGTRVQVGWDILTNNGVNFWMAVLASLGAMGGGYAMGMRVG